jgi:hypothetical protein
MDRTIFAANDDWRKFLPRKLSMRCGQIHQIAGGTGYSCSLLARSRKKW